MKNYIATSCLSVMLVTAMMANEAPEVTSVVASPAELTPACLNSINALTNPAGIVVNQENDRVCLKQDDQKVCIPSNILEQLFAGYAQTHTHTVAPKVAENMAAHKAETVKEATEDTATAE